MGNVSDALKKHQAETAAAAPAEPPDLKAGQDADVSAQCRLLEQILC